MTQQQLMDEYSSLPAEAQQQVSDFIAFLRQRYRVVPMVQRSPLADLGSEAFIGMWSSREDFADSSAWLRNTRKAEWDEGA